MKRSGSRRPSVVARLLTVGLGLELCLFGCSGPGSDESRDPAGSTAGHFDSTQGEETGEHTEPALVSLSQKELDEFDIQIGVAGGGTIERVLALPGEVRPNADRLAHIVPRFSGIVTAVRAQVGERVQAGDVLAVIESDESLAPYELKTLMDGTVIEKHVAPGESVARGDEGFTIADLKTVWVQITVYPRDFGRIRVGQAVRLFVDHGPAAAEGSIGYVSPLVDERTRTATARVVLPNSGDRWKPGMFVTAKVLAARERVAVAVPKSAITSWNGESVLFVQQDGGFAPRRVRLGREGEALVEILEGLETGERFVSQGAFTLKAELEKESFAGGHTH